MSMKQILEMVRGFEGVVELAPEAGSEFPEATWGDHFFYFSPDGRVPQREQPFATIVTKNYPGDTESELDPPDRWRLNIHVGRAKFTELTGEDPRATESAVDVRGADTVLPHPVYRAQGWIAIVDSGARTSAIAADLLRHAHEDARRRKTSHNRDPHG
ncbi:DUF6194 family protein [Rhodococcus sp. NPDC060090]|uniref:DUF6194 family protein n=1 Tax=Rhodococcus sp. NPDC060090 TaxID=3347056 RepID=UPI0036507FE5